MSPPPPPLVLDQLERAGIESGQLILGNRQLEVTVSADPPDVFRFTVRPGKAPPTASETGGSPGPRIRAGKRIARLQTGAGELCVDRQTGAWRVVDPHGLEVFVSPARSTWLGPAGGGGFDLKLTATERLWGFGETTGPFDQRGQRRELWNIDVLGHAPAIHPGLHSLYVSIPLMLSLRDGRAAAVFLNNPARQTWDLDATPTGCCRVTADHGALDLHLFLGPTLPQILERYTALTGRLPLPPRWALGYHQSRYSYETRARLEAVAREFRQRDIPCDALYLDIHHLRGHRVFTFGRAFPRPDDLMRRLGRQGFKVVAIVDPGVKDDPRFGVLRRGERADAFVKAPDGVSDYRGEVWPGRARFPDFLNAGARAWWGREQARLLRRGIAGIWNDMNEPANFARADKTLDPECRHRTGQGIRRHVEVHNLYGLEMARASREGALTERPDERPFIITRAGWAGIQRQALVWTGDNSSTWEHLAGTLPCLLNLSLSGVAFCGSDAGGFLGNCTGELLVRWIQMAAFTPFFRNHTNTGTRDQEPWAFGPETEAICRRYIHLRYQLLPYLYGLFVEAGRTGAPVMRPLAWHYPNDPVAAACGTQFLLGPALLVAPVLEAGAAARAVYLPPGTWFDFWTGEACPGREHRLARAPLDTLPLFVKAGTILPMTATRPFIGDREPAEVVLHVWPGARGELAWYEDDGRSLAYERGERLERTIRHEPNRRGGRLEFGPAHGRHPSTVRQWRIVLRAQERRVRAWVNRRLVPVETVPESGLASFTLANDSGPVPVAWA